MIINLPKDLEKETTHRYGPNSFKLHRWGHEGGVGVVGAGGRWAMPAGGWVPACAHVCRSHGEVCASTAPRPCRRCCRCRCRLPMPRPGQVLGLVGSNGTGKSTALKILAGKLKPNLGRFDVSGGGDAAVGAAGREALVWGGEAGGGEAPAAAAPSAADRALPLPLPPTPLQGAAPDWSEILTYFRGSELQNYFQRVLEDDVKAIIKPQYVDHIPKVRGGRGRACGALGALGA